MPDIHELLVPVDFSDASKAALEQAASIGTRLGANLHVLHVWQVPEFLPAGEAAGTFALPDLTDTLRSYAAQQLEAFVAEAKGRGVAIARAFTEMGPPSSTIVQIAATQRYDLIVMGTHGRTGVAHALLGSVAERVVRRSPCPVMTVRGSVRKQRSPFRKILAPVDYSEGSRRALDFATDLARAFGAELDVVHVWDRPAYVSGDTIVHGPGDVRRSLSELIRENATEQLKEFLGAFSAARGEGTLQFPPHRLLSGEPGSTLISELEKGAHDLVVVGTHGRTGFRRMLLGSIAEKLVRYSPAPVVTVPPAPSTNA